MLEQAEAERQKGGSSTVGEEAEVTDAHKAAWQQVKQEAAQELIDRQSHDPWLVSVGGVSPAEVNVAIGESDQSAVGDGDAVGIGAEVTQDMLWSAEGWLGVDHPVVTEQATQPSSEVLWFG